MEVSAQLNLSVPSHAERLTQLPTFILALGSINPDYRSDGLFAAAFFAARILFHIVLCISYLHLENQHHVAGDSIIPGFLLVYIFPLHAWRFTGCVKGMMRRKKDKTGEPNVIALDISQESLHVGASHPCPPSPTTALQIRRSSSSPEGRPNVRTLRLNVLEVGVPKTDEDEDEVMLSAFH
jgi:hypothetical protein